MPENEYTYQELQQLLDISNSIIEQLDFFNENFTIDKDLFNQSAPQGMNDNQAMLYVIEQRAAHSKYIEMTKLSNEPIIAWIKLLENSEDRIYLVCRGEKPNDYNPKDYPKVNYISKQAPLASELFKNKLNDEFNFKNIQRKILFRDRYFIPQLHPLTDALQNTIELTSRNFSLESLRKILELNKVRFTDEYKDRIKAILDSAQLRKGYRRRIIQNIQLRDQPILDAEQITVYRIPLTSNLAISGSPGTGKTTVLLNRISLATKPENLTDEEKIGIPQRGLELLISKRDNWILYTPTELLEKYLEEAFNKEGIPTPDGKIKVWHEERLDLGRNVLKFLMVADKGQFRIATRNIFKKRTNIEIEQYSDEFKNYYLKSIEDRFFQSLALINEYDKTTLFPNKLNNIKRYYDSLNEGDYQRKITNLIERLNSEREYFVDIRSQNIFEIEELVERILKEKPGLIDNIIPLIADVPADPEETLEEELSDQDDESDIDNNEQLKKEEKVRAYQQLKNALWQFSERKIKKQSVSSKSINGKILELVNDILEKSSDKINLIGTLRLTSRLTNQLTSGYIRNFVQLIPNYYLQFRNKILKEESQDYFESALINDIKERKYISEIETDILIFNMLGNTREYFNKNLRQLSERASSDYLEIIKSVYKNIVCVDEATDFSSITLGCMNYLCNPLIRSFTLSGDPMQRVTLYGIQDWENLAYLKVKTKVEYLRKVYRQSHKLLEIAKRLYSQFVGEPQFVSAFEADEYEPAPLIFQNTDDNILKEWITNRIIEIYKITEGKASIALFVSDDKKIDALADLISEDLMDNCTLEVERCKGGKILSNNSKVRIFSVEYIKGLEFEAVFYINIDDIFLEHPNLSDKYLYVGITRAGSFLGLTYKNEFPVPLNCIRDLLQEGNWADLT